MSHSGTALIDPHPIFDCIHLSKGMRVADLGCGRTGHFVFPASKVVGDTGIVYAVEIVKDILENIRHRVRSEGYDNVQPIWADIEMVGKIPVPATSLDSCFLVNVLFLLKDKASVFAESARLLKKQGTIVVVDWAKKLGPLGPSPDKIVPAEYVVQLAESCGFSLLAEITPGDYHYCLIFQKI